MAHGDTTKASPRAKPAEMSLRAHLDPREQVLWTGRPVPLHAVWAGFPGTTWLARVGFLATSVVALAPFSLAGVYFAWASAKAFLGFDSIAAMLGAPLLFAFGMVLAIAPWYLMLRPRLRNLRNARDAWYVITSERALVLLVRDDGVVDEHAAYLQGIKAARLVFERRDGSGDVLYAVDDAYHGDGGSGWTRHEDVGFIGVPAAREVLGTLERAMAGSRGRKAPGEA